MARCPNSWGVLPYISHIGMCPPPPQRVWNQFWAFLVWKPVQTLPILVWSRVGFSRQLQERMNVFIVLVPNESERNRNMQIQNALACVASVSVWFRSKERGTRVKDSAKNGSSERAERGWWRKEGNRFFPSPPLSLSFIFMLSLHFLRCQNQKSPSLVFLCFETKRKRLVRRLKCV